MRCTHTSPMTQQIVEQIASFLEASVTSIQEALDLQVSSSAPTDINGALRAYNMVDPNEPDKKKAALQHWIKIAREALNAATTAKQALNVHHSSPNGSGIKHDALDSAIKIASNLITTATSAQEMADVPNAVVTHLQPDVRKRFMETWFNLCTTIKEIKIAHSRAKGTEEVNQALSVWIKLCTHLDEMAVVGGHIVDRNHGVGLEFAAKMESMLRAAIEECDMRDIESLEKTVTRWAPTLVPLVHTKWDALVQQLIPSITSLGKASDVFRKARNGSEQERTVLEIWSRLGLEAVEKTESPDTLKGIYNSTPTAVPLVRVAVIKKLARVFATT